MYVVTTRFVLAPEHYMAFRTRAVALAAAALTGDPPAKVFDVCLDPEDDLVAFLYRVFETPEAYLSHRETTEAAFEADAAGWITERTDRAYRRL